MLFFKVEKKQIPYPMICIDDFNQQINRVKNAASVAGKFLISMCKKFLHLPHVQNRRENVVGPAAAARFKGLAHVLDEIPWGFSLAFESLRCPEIAAERWPEM